ncbi:septal ring lytic transglycosylase RlpA family protein [Photobacterium leiognathi]|uniref:septal ring lytic transglycosylase RlpA family protein n=1 Tax=Photobacterium leiognathi TaxID=553611 RepID=UPI000769BAD9|nr:septal ring lytic transglycosylase RlpA family protein [Photobacterium leiognathi]
MFSPRMKFRQWAVLGTCLLAVVSCAKTETTNLHNTPPVLFNQHVKQQNGEIGKASYYADKYQGRKTASGQRYDKNKQTAAHRTLLFGTRVKVTNLANNKSVVVTINDRGPYSKGRIIDLSRSAFSAIGNISSGILKVKVETLN